MEGVKFSLYQHELLGIDWSFKIVINLNLAYFRITCELNYNFKIDYNIKNMFILHVSRVL